MNRRVEVEIKTGRTHQIRFHLASINHPVGGDGTYNEGRDNTVNDVDIKNAIRILDRFSSTPKSSRSITQRPASI